MPELSVVIFATNADPDTPGAVQSVLDQDIPCEIIVVNSNGGDMAGLLTAYTDRITIIEHAELLYAGGARNLGIAAATCPYIAFLACDCRAAEGWARYRLARHRDGVSAVASSVMHDRPWNLVAWADHLVLFPRRLPHLPRQLAIKYSVSYSRVAIDRHGSFDPTMRIGEDTEYNARFAPGERLENGARRKLVLLARKGRYAWNLRLRELFAADLYRTDGIWGNKRVPRFFPAFSPPLRRHQSLHDCWFPKDRFKTRRCNINIYHLKMIAPVRRLGRRDLYKHLDPGNFFQQMGYDYLADERGMTLEEIPKHRRYSPVHVDDGGLWMPKPPATGVNGGKKRGMLAQKTAEPFSL